MKIIEQSHQILTDNLILRMLPKLIEIAARTCYKSEDKITKDSSSAYDLCQKLIKRGHEAMLEHGTISVRFITDRGVTHELVRHRMASFAQESTRYVTYGKDMEFIKPIFIWTDELYRIWKSAMQYVQNKYIRLLELGCSPQEARSVLPNSVKTEIVVTANIREWRHILKLRTAKGAHPQIRELMKPLLKELQDKVPVLFDNITVKE